MRPYREPDRNLRPYREPDRNLRPYREPGRNLRPGPEPDPPATRPAVTRRGSGGRGPGSSREAGGLGIIGMRERAQTLGGSFALERPTDGGTRVVVRLPSGPTTENRSDAVADRRVS